MINKVDLVEQAVYFAGKLNTKYLGFKMDGLGKVYEKEMKYNIVDVYSVKNEVLTEAGNLTKSKKYYNQFSADQLTLLVNDMKKLHLDDEFGTVKKYKKKRQAELDAVTTTPGTKKKKLPKWKKTGYEAISVDPGKKRRHKKKDRLVLSTVYASMTPAMKALIKDERALLDVIYQKMNAIQVRKEKMSSDKIIRETLYEIVEGNTEIFNALIGEAVLETTNDLFHEIKLKEEEAKQLAERNKGVNEEGGYNAKRR